MPVRLFLIVIALAYTAFGLWSLFTPIQMAAQLGVEVAGPNGAYEMRGIYGGVSLGAAALAAAGAISAQMTRPALWFLVAFMGGYVFARLAALALGPGPTPIFYAYVGFEVAVLAGALAGLRAIARSPSR